MFGLWLMVVGTFFEELSMSLEKFAVRHRLEGCQTVGFVNCLFTTPIFLLPVIFFASERTLIAGDALVLALYILLNIVQAIITVHAITTASRSTFGFIRTGTIPLVLIFDTLLGYRLAATQVIGILVIMATLFYLYKNHGFDRKSMGWVACSAYGAALTTELFKYLVNHGNSVALTSLITYASLAVGLFLIAVQSREKPLSHLKNPAVIAQSFTLALAALVENYAFLFLNASIIMAVKRSLGVAWSIVTGRGYFREHGLGLKIIGLTGIVVGLVLLAY